jgi:hypothetical protein
VDQYDNWLLGPAPPPKELNSGVEEYNIGGLKVLGTASSEM